MRPLADERGYQEGMRGAMAAAFAHYRPQLPAPPYPRFDPGNDVLKVCGLRL